MKRSLAHGPGYLEIDHRDSPGLTAADVAHVPGAQAVGAGQHFETDIFQCSHCQRGVIRARITRKDPPDVCPKCYHYVCQACHALRVATGQCVPMVAVIDHVQNQVERFGLVVHPDPTPAPRIILTDAPDHATDAPSQE